MASDKTGTCTQLALIGYRIHGDDGKPLGCALTPDGHHWHYDRAEDITWQRGTPEECQASLSCQLPADCPNGPEPHPFIPPLPDVDLPCCRQPWEGRQPLTVAAVSEDAMEALGQLADAVQEAAEDG